MKYMLLIYDQEKQWAGMTAERQQEIMARFLRFTNEIQASGNYVSGSRLQPVATATSVRVRDGKAGFTDGPFAETREQLGGYYLIEARDLDEALAIAARVPAAEIGTIEVRPLCTPA